MGCNKRFNCTQQDLKNCACKLKKKCCCINSCSCKEIKKLGKLLIGAGIFAILILCFPPTVWFVIMAIAMIVLGIKIFRI